MVVPAVAHRACCHVLQLVIILSDQSFFRVLLLEARHEPNAHNIHVPVMLQPAWCTMPGLRLDRRTDPS